MSPSDRVDVDVVATSSVHVDTEKLKGVLLDVGVFPSKSFGSLCMQIIFLNVSVLCAPHAHIVAHIVK